MDTVNPKSPTNFVMGKDLPVGYIVVDPLGDNYKKYKDIADITQYPIKQPLWFTFLDHEYGIQDNLQHNYDEVRPYMRSEPFRYYAGSNNVTYEFMVRFFATKSAKKDVHAQFELLKAMQYPWRSLQDDTFTYPPPKLIMVLNYSLRRIGYIVATNVTWFSPIGQEGNVLLPSNEYGNREYTLVSYYAEVLLTFIAVGNPSAGISFRDIPSADLHYLNYLTTI